MLLQMHADLVIDDRHVNQKQSIQKHIHTNTHSACVGYKSDDTNWGNFFGGESECVG